MKNSKQKNSGIKYYLRNDELIIDELLYKPDLALTEKYQAYSTELLRISLIGIAVIGFIYEKLSSVILFDYPIILGIKVEGMFIASLFFLAISSAFALMHRYYSSDSMSYMISILRYNNAANNENDDEARKKYYSDKSKKERMDRNKIFRRCGSYLAASAIAIGLGTFCIAIGFLFGIK